MYNADRCSKEFIEGLHYFLSMAEANKQNGFMCCLCVHRNNNMFPFERFMGVLKKCVRNRARTEGSIASAYGTEEVIDFVLTLLMT